MLNFQEITLLQKPLLEGFLSSFGEDSCQHSFATSFCYMDKYGDAFDIKDGYLFIMRKGRETEESRCYLFPFGDTEDRQALKAAIDRILYDAHSNGKSAFFESVTKRAATLISELYPGRFLIREERDLCEYLYLVKDIIELRGKEYYSKRRYVNAFWRDYGDRARIEHIAPCHYEGIKKVHDKWLAISHTEEYADQLRLEHETVERALLNYKALDLCGLVILIDERVEGYIFGSPLNPSVMDAMVGKVNRAEWKNLYPVLYQSFAKECCCGFSMVNWEEDLGDEGLRQMKLSYRPARLIKKYIVAERIINE